MSVIAESVAGYLEKSSWIRKMFEAGAAMKAEHGEDAVCDFSLGNPDLPPPPRVAEALRELADMATTPFAFGYMPNAGYPWLREKLADHLAGEQGASIAADDIVVTCGAAGGLNAVFKAVLNPGDEVLCPRPYFVEYGFYATNHQGVLTTAPVRETDFGLDVAAMAEAITPRTRVVLVNSPNNPTGAIYDAQSLAELAALLEEKRREHGRPIFLVADEPYRFLTYDDATAPPLLAASPYAVLVSSFSKNLGLAGERIGYVAPNPAMPEKQTFLDGVILANRILGFVNAPAVGQRLVHASLGAQVDTSRYARRRDAMAAVLDGAGLRFVSPKGGFYFFPQVPEAFAGDDVAFCKRLAEERILAVPGRGFGMPGYIRLTFCVPTEVIERSAAGFVRAVAP